MTVAQPPHPPAKMLQSLENGVGTRRFGLASAKAGF
jgi:hypothetical protein